MGLSVAEYARRNSKPSGEEDLRHCLMPIPTDSQFAHIFKIEPREQRPHPLVVEILLSLSAEVVSQVQIDVVDSDSCHSDIVHSADALEISCWLTATLETVSW